MCVRVCVRVCVRGLGGNDVCALLPPAPRELWPPHQGREVGLRPLRDPAGSSLGWICGAQSHDPPRAPPPFPVWENARGSPDGCPGGALLCGQPWVMGDVGHLDVQPGTLLAELQPPGTLALPAFSKPPGEERRGVMAPGCSRAGVRRALPAEWGPVLPPRVCLSLWLLGTSQLAWGGGRGWGAWLVSPALSSMLESRPPHLAPRSGPGSARGPFPGQDWPGGLTQPLFPRPCPMATQGCAGPSQSPPTQPAPSVFQAEVSGGLPTVSLPGRGSPSASGFPQSRGTILLGGPVSSLCVLGGQGVTPGESGNQAQVALCWGVATGKYVSLGPAWAQEGRRGWGSRSVLHPQIQSPRTPNTPARPSPSSCLRKRVASALEAPRVWSLASRPRWCWGLWGQDQET